MNKTRTIIEIDEELCNGCGQCILSCAEGALALVDGKARLVGEVYCDGLGACIGECPTGALKIVEREAAGFDEAEVQKRLLETKAPAPKPEKPVHHGCPSAAAMTFAPKRGAENEALGNSVYSQLRQWPLKLQLLNPDSPFLAGADLLLIADCAGFAFPELYEKKFGGHAVAIGCPKFEDGDVHINRLAEIFKTAKPKSVTVVHMEVPCCHGYLRSAVLARQLSRSAAPITQVIIDRRGNILESKEIPLSPV
jgi:ferredoxin